MSTTAAKCDAHETAVCNTARGTTLTAWTPFLSLHSADPTETGETAEVNGTNCPGYVRQAITFGPPTDGVMTNSAAVTFPTASGDWVAVTHHTICQDSTGATARRYRCQLDAPKTVLNGDYLQFPIGSISVSET